MSEVRLNIKDANDAIHGTVHGSVADAVVAALSAEPETIAELEAALKRFIKPVDDRQAFASFHPGANDETWDAGLVIVDLAARIVASESSYSAPAADGEVRYHDGNQAADVSLLYRVPDDWLFVSSVDEYEAARDRRRSQRSAAPPLDVRRVLYGKSLNEFIVKECLARVAMSNAEPDAPIAEIHARWLMTPRADLRDQTPRELLLAKLAFIDFELHSRELQWSFLGEGAPALGRNSFAYRFAGFGTHEYVIYYDLLRHLLSSCWQRVHQEEQIDASLEAARLESIEQAWLNEPQPGLSGRIPIAIIESERRRIPIAMSAKAMMIDENCDVCRMLAGETGEDFGPGFWHLDGCNMDEGFEFSAYRTRAEWEEEERRRKEFDEEFNRNWAEQQKQSVVDDRMSADD